MPVTNGWNIRMIDENLTQKLRLFLRQIEHDWCRNPEDAQRAIEEVLKLTEHVSAELHLSAHYQAQYHKALIAYYQSDYKTLDDALPKAQQGFLNLGHQICWYRCEWLNALNDLQNNRILDASNRFQYLLENLSETVIEQKVIIALVKNGIGSILLMSNHTQEAIDYFSQALAILQQTEQKFHIAETHNLLSEAYQQLEDITNALIHSSFAEGILDKFQCKFGMARARINSAINWMRLDKLDSAINALTTSIMLAEGTNERYQNARAYIVYAEVQEKVPEKTVNIRNTLHNAENILKHLKESFLTIKLHEMLYKLHKLYQRYELALQHLEIARDIESRITKSQWVAVAKTLLSLEIKQDLTHDIINKLDPELRSQQHIKEFRMALQLYDEVSGEVSVKSVADLSLDSALRMSNAKVGFIALKTSTQLVIQALIGKYDYQLGQTIRLEAELQELVDQRNSFFIPQEIHPDNFPRYSSSKARIILPLFYQEQFIGIITLETPNATEFTNDKIEFLNMLKDYISIALINSQLNEVKNKQFKELELAHQNVSELEKLKTEMIRLAAHDLKNPLSVIKLYLGMIQMSESQMNSSQQTHLQVIGNSVQTMTNIINNILSLQRIEMMATQGLNEKINLYKCINYAVDAQLPPAMSKEQYIKFESNLQNAEVLGDHAQLSEAISNLISNAIKYSPDKSEITVTLELENSVYRVSVIDRGYGIDKDKQKDLFQAFSRATNDITQHIQGTGLGLYLVKSIIVRHRGSIFFESELNKGSTFGFSIPIL
jgi:signal transduction histidine kinase/tetratricopeptide (TPR) repeat protein